MLRGRNGIVAALVAVIMLTSVLASGRPATAADPCTDPDTAGLLPQCARHGIVTQLIRQVCSYVWVEGLCAQTRYPDPGYSTTTDPNPTLPLALRVGAVHEHSGYSDGDPTQIPRDYYRAAKTGHNVADAGGDTGVKLDFMLSSEHSDNEQIPITTAAVCIEPGSELFILGCQQINNQDHYFKWPAMLRQAREATDANFTGVRGFEWTNDVYNHMNVYFSRNFTNVKVDGSYATMDRFWKWLRTSPYYGGGADALVTFNHPGRQPGLTPFDQGLPHNELLESMGGSNWNDVAYVPAADKQVTAMEVNGGDDIQYYVKGLTNGWHMGAVANEDEHEREWSTSNEGKTLLLTRGTSPKDYYYALSQQRSIAIMNDLVGGAPGTKATFPTIHYYADGTSINDPASTVLGSTLKASGTHTLNIEASGLPANSRVALVSNTTSGQAAPIQLGAAGGDGTFDEAHAVTSPASGQDWYFVVVCPPASGTNCGKDLSYSAVTAPIWFAPTA